MTNRVWIVTRPDLGWDCVVAVYEGHIPLDYMLKAYPSPEYVITNLFIGTMVELREDILQQKEYDEANLEK